MIVSKITKKDSSNLNVLKAIDVKLQHSYLKCRKYFSFKQKLLFLIIIVL